MTALGKLFRTTTFKLTLVYLTVFALFAAFLLGYFALNTRRLITEQITDTVDAEITGLTEQYRQGGIGRLVLVVECARAAAGLEPLPGDHVHGQALAGNVTALQPGILDQPSWTETVYRRLDETEEHTEHHALVRVFQAAGRLPPAGRPRSRRARAALPHRAVRRALVDRDRHGAGLGRRLLRDAAACCGASTP